LDDANRPPVDVAREVVSGARGTALRRDSEDGGLIEVASALTVDDLAEIEEFRISDENASIIRLAKARIAAAGLVCSCRTPWDDQKKPGGYHCPDCHTNWASYGLSQMHRRDGRCLHPSTICDVGTGHRLLTVRRVNGFDVWCSNRLQASQRPGFKYE
jgi:hypothetical protein